MLHTYILSTNAGKHEAILEQCIQQLEIWYLVRYEDDDNLRVLGRDEIHHYLPR